MSFKVGDKIKVINSIYDNKGAVGKVTEVGCGYVMVRG